MRTVHVKRESDGLELARRCQVAESAPERMVGLMGRASLAAGEGLWIEPCNAIHTFFMRFPIDVVYLDSQRNVVDVCSAVRPWRMHWIRFKARAVLELPSGGAASLQAGDRLCIS